MYQEVGGEGGAPLEALAALVANMLTERFVVGCLLWVVVTDVALQGRLCDRHVTTNVALELLDSLVTHLVVSQGSGVG